jgi:protein gp37
MKMGMKKYANGFKVTLHPNLINEPYKWKKPRMVFVNSMSDLFHKDIPDEFIKSVFDVMADTPQHTYQILTKRAERLAEFAGDLPWMENIWMGVSVENEDYLSRIDCLRKTSAKTRFLSVEPLLGRIDNLLLQGIHWVIVGGESGPKSRPMNPDWVRTIRDQCIDENVPFFFKQWGGKNKKVNGRILDGKTWDQMPITVKDDRLLSEVA